MSLTLPTPVPVVPIPFWRHVAAWFSPTAYRTQPHWLPATLLTAALVAILPMVHLHVYGASEIADAAVALARQQLGAPLGAEIAAMVRQSVLDRSMAGAAVAAVLVTGITVLLAGMVLNVGALLVGAELSAAQALSVTALASLGATLLRVSNFAVVAIMVPREVGVAPDWVHTASLSVASWVQSDSPALWTFYSAVDAIRVAQVVLSVLVLRAVQPRIGLVAATAASVLWAGLVVGTLVALSAVISLPII